MSRRQLSRAAVPSRDELGEMGRMERLYWHVLYPFDVELSDKEDKYLDALKQVFGVTSDELSRSRALQKIDCLPVAQMWPSTRLLNDAEYLFGSMVQSNKVLDRAKMYERYIRLGETAEEAGEIEVARGCYDSAAKLKDLFSHDKESVDWSDVHPPEIVITSDPAALKKPKTEHEEADIL